MTETKSDTAVIDQWQELQQNDPEGYVAAVLAISDDERAALLQALDDAVFEEEMSLARDKAETERAQQVVELAQRQAEIDAERAELEGAPA